MSNSAYSKLSKNKKPKKMPDRDLPIIRPKVVKPEKMPDKDLPIIRPKVVEPTKKPLKIEENIKRMLNPFKKSVGGSVTVPVKIGRTKKTKIY